MISVVRLLPVQCFERNSFPSPVFLNCFFFFYSLMSSWTNRKKEREGEVREYLVVKKNKQFPKVDAIVGALRRHYSGSPRYFGSRTKIFRPALAICDPFSLLLCKRKVVFKQSS